MSLLRDDVRLSGFNNLTKVVSFNLYDFFVARTERERLGYVAWIDEQFSAARITGILREIARIIDAEVLSVSDQDYEPHGASSLVLMSGVMFFRAVASGSKYQIFAISINHTHFGHGDELVVAGAGLGHWRQWAAHRRGSYSSFSCIS